MSEQEVALVARITGRVQGVSYRLWAREQAEQLGIRGWVRNEPDGSVSALVVGGATMVEGMIAKFRDGPSADRVDEVTTEPHEGERPEGFRITG